MRIVLLTIVLSVAVNAAEPSTAVVIAEVRSIIIAPDQWTDLSAEFRKLESLAKRCPEAKKGAVISFRQSLASYSAYLADHPFTLSAAERAALQAVIQAYEERLAAERDRILASWRKHPDQNHGCIDAATQALMFANNELDKFAPIFAPHNSRRKSPERASGSDDADHGSLWSLPRTPFRRATVDCA